MVDSYGALSWLREPVDGARSPELMLLGNQWRLGICPGGVEGAAEGMVTLKAIEIDYGFSINNCNGKQVAYKRTATPRILDPWTMDLPVGGTIILRRA